MLKLDKIYTKDEIQALIVNEWISSSHQGYILASTGFGKSVTAIKCILSLNNPLVHIIVPSIQLKTQWELELIKWKITNTHVYVINSYVKDVMLCDFLILDEIHKLIGDDALLFNKCLHDSTYQYFLGLTATASKENKETLSKLGIPCLIDISFKQAVLQGWVVPVEEYNIFLPLTDEENVEYKKVESAYKFYFRTFLNDWNNVNKCLTKEGREEYIKSHSTVNTSMLAAHATQFFNCVRKRKTLIYNAFNKYSKIAELCNLHSDEKIIIFSESTAFCIILQDLIGSRAFSYHSKIPTKKRELNLNNFKNSSNGILIGGKAVDEGFDDPTVTVGIIASSTSKDTKHRQRLGRIARYLRDKRAILYNLVIQNTQDESWTITKQKYSKPINYEKVTSLESVSGDGLI